MHNCIILIGPPCSGKSTIGRKLADLIHYKYVSSGDIARNLADKNEHKKLDNGEMFDEERMRNEIHNILLHINNVVLDGFPRFEDQLVWLMKQFPSTNYVFMHIDTPFTEITSRAVNRGREDDKSINKRLCYYIKNTQPILELARTNGYTVMEVEN